MINIDDITHIDYIENQIGLPANICMRYNPGNSRDGGNDIIGLPAEAKYGMTYEQIIESVMICKSK
jgi:diaminopimelate decarboxylase